jgi:hypothetical protein
MQGGSQVGRDGRHGVMKLRATTGLYTRAQVWQAGSAGSEPLQAGAVMVKV